MSAMTTLPLTSPRRYIGGRAALNLLSDEGSGDWHPSAYFYSVKGSVEYTFGEGCAVNTVDLLGIDGISDCSQKIRDMGLAWQGEVCYAASHERALADLVLASLRGGGTARHLSADEVLPGAEQKCHFQKTIAQNVRRRLHELRFPYFGGNSFAPSGRKSPVGERCRYKVCRVMPSS